MYCIGIALQCIGITGGCLAHEASSLLARRSYLETKYSSSPPSSSTLPPPPFCSSLLLLPHLLWGSKLACVTDWAVEEGRKGRHDDGTQGGSWGHDNGTQSGFIEHNSNHGSQTVQKNIFFYIYFCWADQTNRFNVFANKSVTTFAKTSFTWISGCLEIMHHSKCFFWTTSLNSFWR